MNYEAILFDMDGTLLDTLEDIGDATNRVLAKRGFPTHSISTYRQFVGEGSKILITRALPEAYRNEKLIDECLQEFIEYYDLNCMVKSKPYDGIPGLLDALIARGLKLAILSNKPDLITKTCVKTLLSKWHFVVVFGQRDSVPCKPNPQSALELAAIMGIHPSKFLYLGDTGIDMQTAVSSGMFPVGVLWGFRPLEELKAHGARMVIDDPLKVLDILDRSVCPNSNDMQV
ncbi:MAG: HAD family hydrolase [Proteobacteria bacterium]|nr:HAD family hydrolase [Pseudomonadota bacterium]